MSQSVQFYSVSNGQLQIQAYDHPRYIHATYRDLKNVGDKEYLDFLYKSGEMILAAKTGRLLADFSELKNYGLGLRAIALNNLKVTTLDKAPYLLVAIVKSSSTFENLGIEVALKTARQLSKKMLDGRLFSTKEEAMEWLINYLVPGDLEIP